MIYTIDEIKEKSKPVFERYSFVKRVYLFGSYSRGKATEKSDIDFFVDIDYPVGLDFFGISMDLRDIFNIKTDVLTLNEIRTIMPKVEERGILIYEREN